MLRTTGAPRAPHLFVIPGRSKERSDAAQTPGVAPQRQESLPRPLSDADDAEFRSAAILGNRRGMDPRVKPTAVRLSGVDIAHDIDSTRYQTFRGV
jgi:hypothetical protein